MREARGPQVRQVAAAAGVGQSKGAVLAAQVVRHAVVRCAV